MLSGLQHAQCCPECGKPICESSADLRVSPLWERSGDVGWLKRFVITTLQLLFAPTRFYRSLATRDSRRHSAIFAIIHIGIASVYLGVAAWIHLDWTRMGSQRNIGAQVPWRMAIALGGLCFIFLEVTTVIAARLTTWEAHYRGIRLPLNVVRRGLDYHAAHYLPVALLAAATVLGFRIFLLRNPAFGATWWLNYLYVICAEVIICALYLFRTYWIAMRNMMYASR